MALSRIRLQRQRRYSKHDAVEARRREGFVYVVTTRHHPGWVKVGRAGDPEARLISANTWDHTRSFKLIAAEYFDDCHHAEDVMHHKLRKHRHQATEWFNTTSTNAVRQLRRAVTELENECR